MPNQYGPGLFSIVLAATGGVVVLFVLYQLGGYFQLWLRAMFAGMPVRMLDMITMRMRRIDPAVIVNSRILASHSGIELSLEQLQVHWLAGGDVARVVAALIEGRQAGVGLPWAQAAAMICPAAIFSIR